MQAITASPLIRLCWLVASLLCALTFGSSAVHAAQTIAVTSATGPALQAAINSAQNGDTIAFAANLFSGTTPTKIVLTSPLVVSKNVTLLGPGDAPGARTPWLQLEGRFTPANRILEISGTATVVVKGIAFQGGAAAGGGAVLIESGATATFQRCDFINNRATGNNQGGAILNRGTLTLDECLVSLNSAANGGGVASLGPLYITRSLIEKNTSTGLGGGAYSEASSIWLESSTFSANTGGTGGALSFVSGGKTNNVASITAVTAMDNVASAQSGGLYVEGSSAVARVAGSIFARNVIVNNGGSQSPHDFATQKSGKINTGDYNIVVKPGTTLSPYGANDQIGVDPLIGALAYDGGRTQTYALPSTSPAVNRGDPTFSGVLVQTDQRGLQRTWPTGGRTDVGAVEFAPIAVTIALVGDATMAVPFGGSFVDPGTTFTGPAGTVVTKSVNGVLNGQVDTCCPGTYEIVYTAISGGSSATVKRWVSVVESVSLSAPASVTRYIELGTGTAQVKLAPIVTVTGLPAGACALQYSVAVTPSGYNQIGLASLPTFTIGQVGSYTVAVKAYAQCGVELGAVSFNLIIDPGNVAWPLAIDLDPKLAPSNGKLIGSIHQMIARAGESRWYKFRGVPGSRIEVALTQLPANFDVVVYSDINQVYNDLLGLISPTSSPADKKLALLGAEFAPEAYSPEAYSPEAYSPEAYSPEAYSPEAYSPEAYSPEAYSPEAYSPEAYSPEAYSPEAYSPEAYSPEAYSPEAYSPEAYASAQQRTLVAFSASPGTVSEGIRFNTYSKSGEFYVRVRGQNGIYSPTATFNLTIAIQQNLCAGVTNFNTASVVTPPTVAGAPVSLILWDSWRIAGPIAADNAALATSITSFATAANAVAVDLNNIAVIKTLNAQADANPFCPIAKNLVADAIRNLVQAYRKAAPTIADITLVGNDDVIPFFRSDDEALLASEANYFPPVKEATQSQSSLRSAQILSQDRYGSSTQVVLSTGPYDLPEIPVGRLVETPGEVSAYLNTYRSLFTGPGATGGILPTPKSAFVAGYDFLADAAVAMRTDFTAGLGAGAVINSLITPQDQAPAFGWTADQWRTAFLGTRHDISFHAAHFSTGRALAADFTTRFRAKDVADSPINLTYALVMSAGCHSGYNTVDKDAITMLTDQPDWAQAFAAKKAIWISGTGYQYGDTDFVEYTERLLLDLARALRTGSGAIGIGKAMVEAKRRYLANTTLMRGIHEKTLLQVALYGLPMVKIDMAGARLTPPAPGGDVAGVIPIGSGPGVVHGLKSGALSFVPALTRVNKTLDVVGTANTIVASYFLGSDGFAAIPGEPVRPLESFNVSRPEGLVRGVGFRSGDYVDLPGFVPFTGAPATETRGVHGQFWTDVFYPVRPWNLNQISEVAETNGIARLNTFPTQYLSDAAESATGTLRQYGRMEFKLFYCPAVSEAALANPPAINVVSSFLSANPSAVTFAIDVAASVGAGVQEVWVTYTGRPGSSFHGKWQSFALNAPSNAPTGIGTWTGVLPLNGADSSQMLFMVQAANGIGAVAASTNFGRYFVVGTSTLDGIGIVGTPTTVVLQDPIPASGFYRVYIPLKAKLMSGANVLVGKRVQFRLGPVIKTALTDASGIASVNLPLFAQPAPYNLEANFAGDAQYQNSSNARPFTVLKMPSQMTFGAGSFVSTASQILANLKAQDGTPLKERTVVFVLTSGSFATAMAEITNVAGQARLPSTGLPNGTYQIAAYFGKPVTLPPPDGTTVPLIDALYEGSSAAISTTVVPSLGFRDENAWINYGDASAPGATSKNLGVSKIEVMGDMSSNDPTFGPNSILASPKSNRVTAYLRAQLSGKTMLDTSITLQVQSNDNTHWRGSANINGTTVDLNVDWVGSGLGRYHVWISPKAGSGPLYNTLPAELNFELILGTDTDAGEKPAGGVSEIGTAAKPWTQQNGTSRNRTS